MAYKYMVVACLVAAASAGLLPAAPLTYTAPAYHSAPVAYAAAPVAKVAAYSAPVAYAPPVAKVAAEYDVHPQYSYAYDVQDGLTGDSKSQHESRDGDVVQGSYSVVDPDGTRRTVVYSADPQHGFNAVVRKEPLAVKVAAVAPVAKVAAPFVAYAAAPAAQVGPAAVAKYSVPVAYSTPVSYSSPVYHH